MKSTFLILLVLFCTNLLFGQHILPETGIKYQLNDTFWTRVIPYKDKVPSTTRFLYKRKAIKTSDGRDIVPSISIAVEPVADSTDIGMYASMKKAKTPVAVAEVLNPGKGLINIPGAVGYRGSFTDRAGIPHKTTLIYIIHNNRGIEMVLDVNEEAWDALKDEFDSLIRSIQFL